MKACSKCNDFKSEELLTDGVCDECENTKPEIFRNLQARILDLETELKKQKNFAENGGRALQLMWGFKFNTDSLH